MQSLCICDEGWNRDFLFYFMWYPQAGLWLWLPLQLSFLPCTILTCCLHRFGYSQNQTLCLINTLTRNISRWAQKIRWASSIQFYFWNKKKAQVWCCATMLGEIRKHHHGPSVQRTAWECSPSPSLGSADCQQPGKPWIWANWRDLQPASFIFNRDLLLMEITSELQIAACLGLARVKQKSVWW